jgi:hypothetical protein
VGERLDDPVDHPGASPIVLPRFFHLLSLESWIEAAVPDYVAVGAPKPLGEALVKYLAVALDLTGFE